MRAYWAPCPVKTKERSGTDEVLLKVLGETRVVRSSARDETTAKERNLSKDLCEERVYVRSERKFAVSRALCEEKKVWSASACRFVPSLSAAEKGMMA